MKYRISVTNRFKKDIKKCQRRNLPMDKLKEVVRILEEYGTLPSVYKPHKLSGKYTDKWECHILPDWLLVWEQNNEELVLLFTNTGTHSDIF